MSDDSTASVLGVALRDRWHACTPDLQGLAHGLYEELSPLLIRAAPIPVQKAQLTRAGGRCADDGTPLTIDPWSPHAHTCPRCGRVHTGRAHDAWWAMGAQLWTVERALQAAVLGRMWERQDLLRLATRILAQLAARYRHYPNRDNALGPTRPFFSTYLESVWLLNGCLAAIALRGFEPAQATLREWVSHVVEPSRALIAGFPEGRSNRQTWHTAALLAAATLLDDTRAFGPLVDGPLGVETLLAHGLLDDGAWFEGENYHLFAHRGLWYGVQLLQAAQHSVSPTLLSRFDRGFVTPWLGVLPDGTFPSRRDSRYAVSVHQWRFAEWCELGLAREAQPLLASWLERLYNSGLPIADTGRARSTADIERDEPPCALSRSSLGWRTLLFAQPTRSAAPVVSADIGVALPAQGLTVLRGDAGQIYVALEGGHPGGGHGHPDRLALTIQDGRRRVLEDPGAGSYVERTLHWYRSTLAHNAPLIDGRSQERVSTELLAFASYETTSWMRAEAVEAAPGVRLRRTVVLSDTHVIDHLEWWADRAIVLDLPMHVDATVVRASQPRPEGSVGSVMTAVEGREVEVWMTVDPGGAGGLEDGFDFLRDVRSVPIAAHTWVRFDDRVHAGVHGWYASDGEATLFRATSPGPPGTEPRRMHWWRVRGAGGAIAGVWSLRGTVSRVAFASPRALFPLHVSLPGSEYVSYQPLADDWVRTREHQDGSGTPERLILRALDSPPRPLAQTHPSPLSDVPPTDPRTWRVIAPGAPLHATLGAAHYRRSETSWVDAGSPGATVEVEVGLDASGRRPQSLMVTVDCRTGVVTVPEDGAENPFDNERADVNADGVQVYLGSPERTQWTAGWLLVPDLVSGAVRQTALIPGSPLVDARWNTTDLGWQLQFELPVSWLPEPAGGPFRFDLIVNERPPDHARRRGQLVLSGASGEFVYLRGDRHDPSRAWLLRLESLELPASTPAPHA